MKIYHGTKATFQTFDTNFAGTGEAGDIPAIWFTDNYKGAYNHALKTRQDGIPKVFECTLDESTIILNTQIPIVEQPIVYENILKYFPVIISTNINSNTKSNDLFSSYFDINNKFGHRYVRDTSTLLNKYLKQANIHAIYDYEQEWTDLYLHGTTTVVFDIQKINIIKIHYIS
ncbi:TPA: hypothetical protein ACS8CD_000288 [Providencia alcalifaciens]